MIKLNNQNFTNLEIDQLPIGRDTFFVSQKLLPTFEQEWLKVFADEPDADPYGMMTVIRVSIEKIHPQSLDIRDYVNLHTRFHYLQRNINRNEIVACVEVWNYEKRPYVFVREEWIQEILASVNSSFGFIDATGIKNRLKATGISTSTLEHLKSSIDEIAAKYPSVLFISVADSIVLKTNWQTYQGPNNFEPEVLIQIFVEIKEAFKNILGCDSYCILSQGTNEYKSLPLCHISAQQNHISLNTLGTPYAQLFEIDFAVRQNVKEKMHAPADLYISDDFFYSLKLDLGFRDSIKGMRYSSSMLPGQSELKYFPVSLKDMKFE